ILKAVERTTLLLGAVIVAFTLVFCSRLVAFSAAIGAVLVGLNAIAIRRVGSSVAKLPREKRPSMPLLLFNVKMGVLMALIYVVLRYLHVAPVAFIIGISTFPVAFGIVAVRAAMRPEIKETVKNG